MLPNLSTSTRKVWKRKNKGCQYIVQKMKKSSNKISMTGTMNKQAVWFMRVHLETT